MNLPSDNFSLIPLDRALDPGAMVGPFRVLHLVERGVRASSYAAEWVGGGDAVTLRLYVPELCRDPARVLRLVHAQAALTQHRVRGATALIDHGQLDDGRAWTATERLRGASLADRLRASPLARPEADRLLLDLARTLAAAHARSVCHGDLRLEDIFLVERDGAPDVRVLDLGAGVLFERAPTSLPAAAAVDVQALGKIAFRLWVGRELDESRDLGPRPADRTRYVGLPVEEERFLLALLSPDPRLRPSLTDCMAWLAADDDERAHAPSGVSTREPPPRKDEEHGPAPRRGRLLLPLAAALIATTALAVRYAPPRRPATTPRSAAAPVRPEVVAQPAADAVLTLEIAERHARAWVDGVPRAITDGEVRIDGAGSHRVRVTARDRVAFDHDVRVEPGQRRRLAVTLTRRQRGPHDLNYLVDPFGGASR